MLKHLWHFTARENIGCIRAEGFKLRDEVRQGIYFSLAGETHWRSSGCGLIEVWLDLEDRQFAEYRQLAGDGKRMFEFFIIPPDVLTERAMRWSFHDDVRQLHLDELVIEQPVTEISPPPPPATPPPP